MNPLSDDDFESLFGDDDLDNTSRSSSKKTIKKKNPVLQILKFLGIVVVVVGVISGIAVALMSSRNQEEVPPPRDTTPLSLQLVNLDQVHWADRICITVSGWQSKVKKMPSYTTPASGPQVRDDMAANLYQNADIVRKRASAIASIPKKAHEEAVTQADQTMVSDNFRIVSDDIDPAVRRATQMLTASINGYASSLTDMAKDLQSVATYDANGLRDAIQRVSGTFNDMNAQFSTEVGSAISERNFDNVVTMEKVASLESCNGSFINSDELTAQKGEEIRQQKVISDFVTSQRCKQFLSNASLVSSPSTSLSDNVNACESILASVTVDPADPLLTREIDTREQERIQPDPKKLGIDPQKTQVETTGLTPTSTMSTSGVHSGTPVKPTTAGS